MFWEVEQKVPFSLLMEWETRRSTPVAEYRRILWKKSLEEALAALGFLFGRRD